MYYARTYKGHLFIHGPTCTILTGGLNLPVFPLHKEMEGSPVTTTAASPVGSLPSEAVAGAVWFPPTTKELYDVTLDRLLALAVFYNDTFGILDSDDLALKRLKFIAFIAC